ncbi:hypothetical protein GpartN1_g1605.t1 [Galdieria partita]|uniref:Peptidase M16C associated domain-containing protein n=1 Tax=Galdieria partita TaxID=83374 RepID=A0A9C7PT54_9RHOD|nr:hypothetical protein GpartN1_g1605.t1 [Galdieria partita]
MAAVGRVAWSFSTPSCLLRTRHGISGTLSAVCKAQVIQPGYRSWNPVLRLSSFSGLSLSRRSKRVLKPSSTGDWLRRYISAVITDRSQKSTEEAIRENIPKRVVGNVYHSFQLVQEEYIPDIDSVIRKYVHTNTGAQLMSILNNEENKTFGVVFRTPPSNSRGTPHILEHSVLCGSRKYPVKEPFVELMKSSLNTFLNAFTFPDKTCYPVASCNLKDFYNLVDVYLDAVFYPNLTPDVLKQEGHHFELFEQDAPITIQGVVYNEMKGVFSNPDSVIGSWSQRCLFPENTYGVESGGDPQEIPDLSWREFQDFYRQLYHPSNTRFWFYGDDPEDMRLQKLEEYLKDFKKLSVDSKVKLQSRWKQPKYFTFGYDAGNDNLEKKHMATVNWMLADVTDDPTKILALSVLDHLLTGTSASPLRKTLTDSGLGEEVIGSGIETDLRQITYSIGLKGMAKEGCESLEKLVVDTLNKLSKDGFSQGEIESSLNTIEFMLKEQNTGSFPKGLALMLRSLTTWLHDSDPLIPLKFEIPLQQLKEILQKDRTYLNRLIEEHFILNTHRAYVSLVPDPEFATKQAEKEMKRIEDFRQTLDKDGIQQLIEETKRLKEKQIRPDDPAQLAKIPALKKSDIDQKAPVIPRQVTSLEETTVLLTPLFTNGIVYFDMAMNIRQLPAHLLSYVPLFGECLLELGTRKEDFVSLQQRIGRETGGIRHSIYCSQMDVPNHVGGYGPAVAEFIIRGKVMSNKTPLLFDILRDVLFDIDFSNKERFRQILIEEKSGVESSIGPSGHRVAASRLNAQYTSSGWADEQMGGISYLKFLSDLVHRLDSEWDSIHSDLETLRSYLVSRSHMTVQVTTDERTFESSVRPSLSHLLQQIPKDVQAQPATSWEQTHQLDQHKRNEGIIVPSTVNYVGKGANLFQLGYQPDGTSLLAMKYLGISYLWERIRVQGGAYGAFGKVDLRTGQLVFLSYRDPHVKKTLDTYDQAAVFLSQAQLSSDEIERCIIGVIGDMDSYQLPDAKGFTNLIRYLSGVTQERLQERRDQVLSCTHHDLVQFGSVLQNVASSGSIVAVGSEQALQQANSQGLDLKLFRATEQ